MKTRFAKPEDYKDNRRWCHVDAEGQILGRLAVRIAVILMGKDRPEWTPQTDTGAFVVVTNAEKIRLTGKKMTTKTYDHYSGYHGGLKTTPIALTLEKHPERVIELAVRRMLPKTKLGDMMFKKLKVYAGPEHPHTYHKPETIAL